MWLLEQISPLIKPILIATSILIVLIFMGVGSILLRRIWQKGHKRIYQKHKNLFISWVLQYLHAEVNHMIDQKALYIRRLSFFTGGAYPRKILLSVLHEFIRNLSDDYRKVLVALYHQLNLDKYAIRKLNSKKRTPILETLAEVRDFEVEIGEKVIEALSNSPFKEVREMTLYQLIDKHCSLLTQILRQGNVLTQWQKILIFKRFEQLPADHLPDLKESLADTSDNTKAFLIDMIGKLKLDNYYDALVKMMPESKPAIQRHLIRSLMAFDREESRSVMKDLMHSCRNKQIVHAASMAIRKIELKKMHRSHFRESTKLLIAC